MLKVLAIQGYRSIRNLVVPLSRLNLVVGANGAGKSSLYRSLRLLADASQGTIVRALALEGGLQSTMWAGPEIVKVEGGSAGGLQVHARKQLGSLKLGFSTSDYGYAIDLGFPIKAVGSAFNLDPEIKGETLWIGDYSVKSVLVSRHGPAVQAGAASGSRRTILNSISPYDSMMQFASTDDAFDELLVLRETMRGWRFYDTLRVDKGAPSRSPKIGTRTPVLAADGSDIAAAIQTIFEIGDDRLFEEIIERAFPGGRVVVKEQGGQFELHMHQEGLRRPLSVSELSEGTLRFIMLATALLTPRPPSIMVLNEPEDGLNISLMPELAMLIAACSQYCQIIVITHSTELRALLAHTEDCRILSLWKEEGQTLCEGSDEVAWRWPSR